MTSAYHPQSNGLDERFNQTLQRQLLKFVENEQRDWDLYIDSILFSYRISCQDSTKQSPFFLVFGRQARLPIEFDIGELDGDDENFPSNSDDSDHEYSAHGNSQASGSIQAPNTPDSTPPDQYSAHGISQASGSRQASPYLNTPGSATLAMHLNFETSLEKMVNLRRKALKNIKAAQDRQKKYYDAKHCKDIIRYKVGSLVLLQNSKKLSKKGMKLAPNWTGPYEIHEVLPKGTYRLREQGNPSKVLSQKVNTSRLKQYFQRSFNTPSTSALAHNFSSLEPSTLATIYSQLFISFHLSNCS